MSGKATAALHVACARADERGVQRALDAGADVNSLDDQHRSVLWLALLGHAEIDSAPDATTEDANRVGVLKLLLARPDINLMTLNSARIVTPLALAAWLNWPKCVNAILKESDGAAAVDCMDAGGATPLMYAARDGSVDVARILLAHGAHVDLCDANTRSVLQHALTSPQIMWMCELALRRQRLKILTKQTQHNPHDPHTASQTALLTLLSNSLPAAPLTTSSTTSPTKSSTTSAAALAAQYAPPSLSRLAPRTLASSVSQLIAAVHVGNVPLLRSLLFPPRSGVAPVGIVNLSDGQGWSALHWALRVDLPVACSRREIVEALWSAGADVGLPTLDERGERLTPLHVFARYAVDEVVGSSDVDTSTAVSPLYALTSYLIHTLKFSLTAKDGHNETPLHAAAERGFSADVLAALLDADVRGEVRAMKNDRGLTPREVAQTHFAGLFADPGTISPLAPTQPRERRRSRSHRASVNGSVSRVQFHVPEHEQLAEISEAHFSGSHESSPERGLHHFPSSNSIRTEVYSPRTGGTGTTYSTRAGATGADVYSTRTGTTGYTGYTAHTFDTFASSATSIRPPPPQQQQPSPPVQEILATKDLSRAMRTLCDLLATSPTSAGVVGGLGSAMGGQGGPFAAAQHAFAPGQGVPVNVNTPFLIQPTTTPAASNTSLFTGLTGLSINTSGSDELPALAALVLRSLLHRATSLGEQTIDLRGTRARSAAILLSAREVQRERLREIEGRERRERRERRSSKVSVKSVKSINHGGEEKVRKRASFLPARFSRDRERGAVPPSPTVGSSHGHGYGAEEVPPLPVDHREWSKAKERLLANAKSAPDLRTVSSTSSFVDVLKGVFSFKRAGKENRDASATQAHADDGKKKRRPVVRISTANISVARQEHEHLQPPSFPSSPVVAGYPSSPVVGSSKTANTHANTSTSQFGALSPLNSPAASRSATPVAFGGLVPPSGPRVDDDGAGSVRSVGTKRPRLSSMFSSSKDNSGGSMPPSPTTAPATTTSFRHPMNFGEEFSAVDPAVVRNAPKLFVRIEADLGQLDVALADLDHDLHSAKSQISRIETVIDSLLNARIQAQSQEDIPPPTPPKDLFPPNVPPKGPHQLQQASHASAGTTYTPSPSQHALSGIGHGRTSSVSSSAAHSGISTAPTSVTGSSLSSTIGSPLTVVPAPSSRHGHGKKPRAQPQLESQLESTDESYVLIDTSLSLAKRTSILGGLRYGPEVVDLAGLPLMLQRTSDMLDSAEADVARLSKWTRVSRDTAKASRRALVG